jgi:GT2 family glycosyltransferase
MQEAVTGTADIEPASERASSSFIIATRNRPDELLKTVISLVQQTIVPGELCIVDSSDATPVRDEIERLCSEAGLPLDYHHPAPRGLTVQRNVGIDRTSGDPVFFIDDDVFLAPDCHALILDEYERWGAKLGGIRAERTEPARPPLVSIVWRKLFGIGGWWPEASGKMKAAFFVEGVSQSAGVRKLEYFNGWFMSYRREVLGLERFDEALSGYAYKEDVDFSYRVFRHGYTLIQLPRAKVDHFKVDTNRMSPHKLQRMNLGNQFYLHRKNMPQTFRYKLALWWALVGLFTHSVGKALQQRDPGWITGLIVGAFEQARGRGLIDPDREG